MYYHPMEMHAWDMYFCSVVAMQFHPGTAQRLSWRECALVADMMIVERRERCPGWDPQSPPQAG